ncbi:MAG TPA: DMT family transporter [Acidimicrobiales bacterium]|nr:DMT family transporter [Acidimicrobiales bacterium]
MAPEVTHARASAPGLTAVGIATVAWGFSAVLVELTPAPALVIAFYRLWIASALLLVLSAATGRRMTWSVWRAGVVPGVLLCADMTLFFSALRHASVAEVTIINALQPVVVILLARPLFGERLTRSVGVLTALAMGAVTLVVLGGGLPSSHHLTGDLLATGSMLAWTGYWLTSKHAREHVGALEFTAAVTVAAAVAVTPVLFIGGETPIHVRAGAWVWFVLLAAVPGSAHVLMNWAHRFVDVSLSSVIVAANPVVAVLGAVAILHQRVVATQIIGGVLAIGAIAVIVWHTQQPASPSLEPIP